MGYIRHHTIVVSSWNLELLEEARITAIKIFDNEFEANQMGGKLVSEIVKGIANGDGSFFIAPDCSKEGWDTSNNGDDARKSFIEWIKTKDYPDGSNSLRYVELFYGDDERQAEIIYHN